MRRGRAALPCENESFDAIIYEQVNVHMEDPEFVLKEFYRVLKTGGLLLFETTSRHDPSFKARMNFMIMAFILDSIADRK